MPSERLGKYRLLRHLATGGMGEVFLARQEGPASFAKTVVVKRLLRHMSDDRTFVDMFLNEARLAAMISHPNVVQLFELGEERGTYFIAMEYVRGRSLRDVIRAAKERGLAIPRGLAVHVVAQVLHGLHAAHTLVDANGRPAGVVHRDVTPENVLVSFDGAVKLTDFGIAKAASLSTAGRTALRGKYAYMAPEQYRNEPIDARVDVFACGIILYELLVGRRPFAGDSEAAVMHAILGEEATPLSELGLGAPPPLSAAVDQALCKAPDDRFGSAEEMAEELEACVAAEGLPTSPVVVRAFMRELFGDEATRPEPAADSETAAVTEVLPAPRRRTRALAFGGGVAVATAATLAVLGARVWLRGPADTREAPVTIATSPATAPPSPSTSVDSTASSERPAAEGPMHVAAPPTASAPPVAPAAPSAPSSDRRKTTARVEAKRPATATGMLSFRIRPWAEVFVDGKSVGVSPMPAIEVPAGRHVIVMRNRDLGTERKLVTEVSPGATATVRADLFD